MKRWMIVRKLPGGHYRPVPGGRYWTQRGAARACAWLNQSGGVGAALNALLGVDYFFPATGRMLVILEERAHDKRERERENAAA